MKNKKDYLPKRNLSLERVCCIYALCCPFSGAIKYIGKTINLESRLRNHTSKSVLTIRTNEKLCTWWETLIQIGYMPNVIILRKCESEDELKCYEKKFIRKYESTGKLLNLDLMYYQIHEKIL